MIVIVIALIIAIIYDSNNYRKQIRELSKKNQELEQELFKYRKSNNGQFIAEKVSQITCNQEIENHTINERQKNVNNIKHIKQKQSRNKDSEGIKNKFILMTGAILIVLAAIVFLTSTWYTIPNIIKTIVIVLLAGVFVGASKIAKTIFKLDETANTFLYIALAYLPISLFSISLFGLIGDYLSISGAGNNLYFAFSTVILSILYFMIGNRRKQIVLIHSSMIMQLLAVIFMSLCVNNSFSIAIFGIIVYNMIIFLLKEKTFREYKSIICVYNNVYLYATMAL